jgi:uncharacterized protein YfiM (DUF2279 family)
VYIFKSLIFLAAIPAILWAKPDKVDEDRFFPAMEYAYQFSMSKASTIHSDSWFSVDKGYHLIGSLISTTGITNSALQFAKFDKEESLYAGAGFTFALGLGKELWDGHKADNRFSWKDLTADMIGILIGSLIMQID